MLGYKIIDCCLNYVHHDVLWILCNSMLQLILSVQATYEQFCVIKAQQCQTLELHVMLRI